MDEEDKERLLQEAWEKSSARLTADAMLAEAIARIRARTEEGPPATDDWVALNEGIMDLVFRTSWSDED